MPTSIQQHTGNPKQCSKVRKVMKYVRIRKKEKNQDYLFVTYRVHDLLENYLVSVKRF